ncbi:MAG: hypothetical protein H9W81_08375 [Enterococcus sp.]|nr:hypothetical protein [Enterococcus sp.]
MTIIKRSLKIWRKGNTLSSYQADEYKRIQNELKEKAKELKSSAITLSSKMAKLDAETLSWQERIDKAEKDLAGGTLSENGEAAMKRLLVQAQNAHEISEAELIQAQELHAKMQEQQSGLTSAIHRLDNIQYEIEMDNSLSSRRKELGLDRSGPTWDNPAGFLREIKKMEYTADALIKIRTDNGK